MQHLVQLQIVDTMKTKYVNTQYIYVKVNMQKIHTPCFLSPPFLLSCACQSLWIAHHDSVSDKDRYTWYIAARTGNKDKNAKEKIQNYTQYFFPPLAPLNGSLRHYPVQNKRCACQDFAHLQMETNCKYNGRQRYVQIHKSIMMESCICNKIFNCFLISKWMHAGHHNIHLYKET